MLIAGAGEQLLDTGHVADEVRCHPQVAVAGGSHRNVQVCRAQQHGMGSDEGQRLGEHAEDVDDGAPAPLGLTARFGLLGHTTAREMSASACSDIRPVPPKQSKTTCARSATHTSSRRALPISQMPSNGIRVIRAP